MGELRNEVQDADGKFPLHDRVVMQNHKREIIDGLLRNREQLVEIGVLSADLSEEEIDVFVEGVVENFFTFRSPETAGDNFAVKEFIKSKGLYEGLTGQEIDGGAYVRGMTSRVRSDYARLLNYAGVVFPTLPGAWKVDRVTSEALRLGLMSGADSEVPFAAEKSITRFEDFHARKYGGDTDRVCTHLHKGPGSGRFMQALNEYRYKNNLKFGVEDEGNKWMQIGVAKRLHFVLSSVLGNFIKFSASEDPSGFTHRCIDYLSFALQLYLYSKRLEVTDPQGYWFDGHDFFDMNVVYDLLANPDEFKKFMIFVKDTPLIVMSGEFENDSVNKPSYYTYLTLLRYFKDFGQVDTENWVKRMTVLLGKLQNYAMANISELRRIKDEGTYARNTSEIARNIMSVKLVKPSMAVSAENLYGMSNEEKEAVVDELIKSYEAILGHMNWTKKYDREFFMNCFELDEKADPLKVLELVFNQEFVESVRNYGNIKGKLNYYENNNSEDSQNAIIDLNQFSSRNRDGKKYSFADGLFRAEGFMMNDFVNMGADMRDENTGDEVNYDIITSIRSDSHEDDEVFKKDLRGNLKMLNPGGVIIIDGLIQSWSRVIRLGVVLSVLEEFGEEYKGWVLFNGNKPHQLTIQRAHPKGFLTPEEFSTYFDPNLEVMDVFAAQYVPYIQVSNAVREKLVQMGGKYFDGKQDLIERYIRETYLEVLVEDYVHDDKLENAEVLGELESVFFMQYILSYLFLKMPAVKDHRPLLAFVHVIFGEMFGVFDYNSYLGEVISGSYKQGSKLPDISDPFTLMTYYAYYLCKALRDKRTLNWRKLEPTHIPDDLVVLFRVFKEFYLEVSDPQTRCIEPTRESLSKLLELFEKSRSMFGADYEPFRFKICAILSELLNEVDKSGGDDFLRKQVDKFHFAFSSKFQLSLRTDSTDDALEKELLKAVLSDAEGKKSKLSFVNPIQIGEIVNRVMDRLGYSHAVDEQIDLKNIYAYPRSGMSKEGVNGRYMFPKSKIPNNRNVLPVTDLEKTLLQRDCEIARELTGMERPIVFINFVDCVTNRSGLERFKDFGIDEYVEVINLNLNDVDFNNDEVAKQTLLALEPYIGRMIQEGDEPKNLVNIEGGAGGLIYIGGSWHDIPGEAARVLKRYIFYPLLDSMTSFGADERAVRGYYVCLAAQMHHDVLVSRYFKGDPNFDYRELKVQPGALEFNLTPFTVDGEFDERIFDKVPGGKLSLVATHSGQIPVEFPGGTAGLWTPIGKNLMTEAPMGFSSIGGKAISYVIHPEVKFPNDLARVFTEMGGFRHCIASALGGLPINVVEAGFDVDAVDAGTRVHFNTIKMQMENLVQDLRTKRSKKR